MVEGEETTSIRAEMHLREVKHPEGLCPDGFCQSLMCVISAFLPRETITFRDHGKENTCQVQPVVSEGC